jgi:hypothetical protein
MEGRSITTSTPVQTTARALVIITNRLVEEIKQNLLQWKSFSVVPPHSPIFHGIEVIKKQRKVA